MEVWIRLRRQEDDEDDPELMQLTEESCVRDLASGYWARARISDAYWFSPADIWYQHSVPGQPGLCQPYIPVHGPANAHYRMLPATVHCRPLTKSKKQRRNIPKGLPSPQNFDHPTHSANNLRRPPAANAGSAASSAQERRPSWNAPLQMGDEKTLLQVLRR